MGDPYVTATHPALNSVCCYTLGGKPPCPKTKMGEVSRPATGEFLGAKGLRHRPTMAPYAPVTAGPNSSLSQRYGPAFIP